MKDKILLTPGPLTTSMKTKQAMLRDVGTRDVEYQTIIQELRKKLLHLANGDPQKDTVLFMQGSGTFGVESVLTSVIHEHEKLLILSNGAYGHRMAAICKKANIPFEEVSFSMIDTLKRTDIESYIAKPDITHVAYVHCETTAGIMNDIEMIQGLIHQYHKISIVDAMSSFGSVPLDIDALGIDYLITSANKCLHGVPGVSIIFAKRHQLEQCTGNAKSHSLDLYDQYQYMEQNPGSFRFTSPTHVLLALNEAVDELMEQGGIEKRNERYRSVQKKIRSAMIDFGFQTLVSDEIQSPVITTFLYPEGFCFSQFYDYFKENGFLLYSGKLPEYDAFRIGNIGEISDEDLTQFLSLLKTWKEGTKYEDETAD